MAVDINKILPVALALLLPGISFISNQRMAVLSDFRIFPAWVLITVFLYSLWYLIWWLSEIKNQRSYHHYWPKLGVSAICVIALFFLFSTKIESFKLFYLVRLFSGILLFAVIQYTLKTQQKFSKFQLEKEQLQTENYKAQLQSLQAKIDPHFLFNSLNTLRSLVHQAHPNTDKFIVALADFYRQTLKYQESVTLSVAQELELLTAYLFLMKSRTEGAILVDIDVAPALRTYHLPTLALQMVMENCFKHNSMTSKMPLRINVTNIDTYIVISNNIQPKLAPTTDSGYGLQLLQKKYELMNVQDGLFVEQTDAQFRVQLKLIKP